MVYKFAKVYTNDNFHYNAQEYLPLCIQNCKHMTLTIRTLKYIFPSHTSTQNYHLKYPNVLM